MDAGFAKKFLLMAAARQYMTQSVGVTTTSMATAVKQARPVSVFKAQANANKVRSSRHSGRSVAKTRNPAVANQAVTGFRPSPE